MAFFYDLVVGNAGAGCGLGKGKGEAGGLSLFALWECGEIGVDAAASRGAAEEEFAGLAEAGFGGACLIDAFGY